MFVFAQSVVNKRRQRAARSNLDKIADSFIPVEIFYCFPKLNLMGPLFIAVCLIADGFSGKGSRVEQL